MITIEKAKELYERVLGREVLNIKTLEGGMAGMVFYVETNSGVDRIFKLYEKVIEKEEDVDDRVYGSNHLNLKPAHKLLSNHDILTFDLLDTGEVDTYTYAIFSLLEGVEPNQEIINQEIYVNTLASIHSITRKYQGWVCNEKSYKINWREAFQKSIYSRLSDARDVLKKSTSLKVKEYIDKNIISLECPDRYVLSHLDGLQAIFKKADEGWTLGGVIDVEDYQFTDQRFVIAGITLGERLGRYKLPNDFLETYQSKTELDITFKDFENLFQIYYLLVWIRVLYEYGNTDEGQRCQDALSDIIR